MFSCKADPTTQKEEHAVKTVVLFVIQHRGLKQNVVVQTFNFREAFYFAKSLIFFIQ